MKMKVMLDPHAKMPTRAHSTDAGLDLYSPVNAVVYGAKGYALNVHSPVPVNAGMLVIDTGVHAAIPRGYVGDIEPKSGMMVKNNITTDGTIDSGYTGSIRVKLFNHGADDVYISKGQKIAQLVIKKIATPDLELVDSLDDTERGDGGFGSTGAF